MGGSDVWTVRVVLGGGPAGGMLDGLRLLGIMHAAGDKRFVCDREFGCGVRR